LRREILTRLEAVPARFIIAVQLAEPNGVMNDATMACPEKRPMAKLGTMKRSGSTSSSAYPSFNGIAPSNDPLLEARANL